MAGRRRHPDPSYTPPTEMEEQLGYAFTCQGCKKSWAKRYQDGRTHRCLPCARAWRRDDMASRRRGLGGVPLNDDPLPHEFRSKTLGRTIDLNSDEGRLLLERSEPLRSEVDAYISGLVAKNARPTPPLHGVLPLLAGGKSKKPVRPNRPPVPEQVEPEDVSPDATRVVDEIVENAMNVIDGEIVGESD